MAPKVIDYSKSVIYKIEHVDNPELLYVGSTTDFIRRKSQHKNTCINSNSKEFNKKLYHMIRTNGNWEVFKMMIIKEYPCNSKTELLIEEEKHRKELQSNLNSFMCYRTIEQKLEYNRNYYKNNKEIILEQKKEYRNKNKEQMNEKTKEKMTCNCGSIFRKSDKLRHEKTLKHINFINN